MLSDDKPQSAPSSEPPEFMTTGEVAVLLRTSPQTVRYWRYIGYGPSGPKVGRRVLYRRRDIDDFLATFKEGGAK